MKPLERVEMLVIHHSASDPRTTTVETIRNWHVIDNGWSDIGYHWVITADGKINPGRPLTLQGAHAKLVNDRSWGVCVVGDNTRPDRRWNDAQENALLDVIESVLKLIPDVRILGHRDTGQATLCPGLDVRAWLDGA